MVISIGFSITFGSYLISRLLDLSRIITGKVTFFEYIKVLGFVFWGGLLIGSIITILFSYQFNIPLIHLTDAIVLGIPIGQLWGRIGCLNYVYCHGRKSKKSSWGISYSHPNSKVLRTYPKLDGIKLYPTQVYSIISNFIIYLILCLLILIIKTPFPGLLTAVFFVLFGMKRFLIEFIRGEFPRTNIMGFTIWQWFAFCLFLLGLYCMIFILDFSNYTKSSFNLKNGLNTIIQFQPQVVIASLIITIIFSIHIRKIGSW